MILVECDKGEQALGDLDFGRAKIAVGHNLDPHPHRRSSDPLNLRKDADQIA